MNDSSTEHFQLSKSGFRPQSMLERSLGNLEGYTKSKRHRVKKNEAEKFKTCWNGGMSSPAETRTRTSHVSITGLWIQLMRCAQRKAHQRDAGESTGVNSWHKEVKSSLVLWALSGSPVPVPLLSWEDSMNVLILALTRVLVLHTLNKAECECLMKIWLWSRHSAGSGRPEGRDQPAVSPVPGSVSLLSWGFVRSNSFGCLTLPVPILITRKVPIKVLHTEVSLDFKRECLEKVMVNTKAGFLWV